MASRTPERNLRVTLLGPGEKRVERQLTLDSDFRIYRMHGRKVLPAILPES